MCWHARQITNRHFPSLLFKESRWRAVCLEMHLACLIKHLQASSITLAKPHDIFYLLLSSILFWLPLPLSDTSDWMTQWHRDFISKRNGKYNADPSWIPASTCFFHYSWSYLRLGYKGGIYIQGDRREWWPSVIYVPDMDAQTQNCISFSRTHLSFPLRTSIGLWRRWHLLFRMQWFPSHGWGPIISHIFF